MVLRMHDDVAGDNKTGIFEKTTAEKAEVTAETKVWCAAGAEFKPQVETVQYERMDGFMATTAATNYSFQLGVAGIPDGATLTSVVVKGEAAGAVTWKLYRLDFDMYDLVLMASGALNVVDSTIVHPVLHMEKYAYVLFVGNAWDSAEGIKVAQIWYKQ